MLEYLGYALFGVLMIACLTYIIGSLETEEVSRPKRPRRKH
jgi:hypothetical protein